MRCFNFLVENVNLLPTEPCFLLPSWLVPDLKSHERKKTKLLQTPLPLAAALNRRHCGQSQQSAVIRRKERLVESKISGAERKKKAKPKKNRISR